MEDKIEIAVVHSSYYEYEECTKIISKWDLVTEEEYNQLLEWSRRETHKNRLSGYGDTWAVIRRVDLAQINLRELVEAAKKENALALEKEKAKQARLEKRLATLKKKQEEKERKKLEELQAKYSKGSR